MDGTLKLLGSSIVVILVTFILVFYSNSNSENLSGYDSSILVQPIYYKVGETKLTNENKDLIRKKAAILLNSNYKIIIFYAPIDGKGIDDVNGFNTVTIERINQIKMEFYSYGVASSKILVKPYKSNNLKVVKKAPSPQDIIEFAGFEEMK